MRSTTVAMAVLLSASLARAVPARATQDLDSLLFDLGIAAPAKREGRVQLVASIERHAGTGAAALTIDFLPQGDAKLVADPGITVSAVAADGVRWPAGTEVRAVVPGESYFEPPPAVRLPVEAPPGATVEADVEYAWCLVGWQCLFGSERVRAMVPDLPDAPTD